MSKTLEEQYKEILGHATKLKSKLLLENIVMAPDLPGIPDDAQMLTKVCVLVAACEAIVAATAELNQQLSKESTTRHRQTGTMVKQATEDVAIKKEKKGWN